jgi:hypothetical protein
MPPTTRSAAGRPRAGHAAPDSDSPSGTRDDTAPVNGHARPSADDDLATTPIPAPADLRAAAARVLFGSWTGASTVPSRTLYPHQWSWDSAFVAIGLRHMSPRRAQRELESLFGAQWTDGRVPHIVFHPSVPAEAYFPGPDFWRSSHAGAAAGAPPGPQTSGIVQPPVHALAALLVHQADPDASAARDFLARLYPRLAAWHGYLAAHRDLGGEGLVAVLHPWESGMDNSPCWDRPLAAVEPVPAGGFRRADLLAGNAADRPTDEDYGRYVRLAADYRDAGYRDDAPHAFAVEDPGFNALLAASEQALAEIAGLVGADPLPHRERAAALGAALVDRLWDERAGMFLCRDLRSGALLPERGVTGLLPLLLVSLPAEVAATLTATLAGPHFGLGTTTRLVPSHDLLSPQFDAGRYWRGPAWFNINWLLERGLRAHGATAAADALAGEIVDAASRSGFAEYVDARTGSPHGARPFGWTAALALDLRAGREEH